MHPFLSQANPPVDVEQEPAPVDVDLLIIEPEPAPVDVDLVDVEPEPAPVDICIYIYIDIMSMKSDNLYMHTYIVCVLKLTVISHLFELTGCL